MKKNVLFYLNNSCCINKKMFVYGLLFVFFQPHIRFNKKVGLNCIHASSLGIHFHIEKQNRDFIFLPISLLQPNIQLERKLFLMLFEIPPKS